MGSVQPGQSLYHQASVPADHGPLSQGFRYPAPGFRKSEASQPFLSQVLAHIPGSTEKSRVHPGGTAGLAAEVVTAGMGEVDPAFCWRESGSRWCIPILSFIADGDKSAQYLRRTFSISQNGLTSSQLQDL